MPRPLGYPEEPADRSTVESSSYKEAEEKAQRLPLYFFCRFQNICCCIISTIGHGVVYRFTCSFYLKVSVGVSPNSFGAALFGPNISDQLRSSTEGLPVSLIL